MRFSGIEVEAVATAAEALLLIQAECFDLYVLDACLPDLDGFELCRRLRDRNSQTPILFYSGATNEIDKKRGIAAGANGYAIKPDVDELFGSIAQFALYAENDAQSIGVARDHNLFVAFQFEKLLRDSAVELRIFPQARPQINNVCTANQPQIEAH